MDPDQGVWFLKQLEDGFVPLPDGKIGLRPEFLGSLVREHPTLTVVAARAYAMQAHLQSGYGQMAVVLAAIYNLEHGDDSLSLYIENQFEEQGITVKVPGFLPNPAPPDASPPAAGPEIRFLTVEPELLEALDTYAFVTVFAYPRYAGSEFDALRRLRQACVLGFPVDDDPRPSWRIPQVKDYMRRVHDDLPYFPYFLHIGEGGTDSGWYFACLADEEAFDSSGNVDLQHPSVVHPLAEMVAGLWELCSVLGEDLPDTVRSILQRWPQDMVDRVVSLLQEGPDANGV